MLHGSGWKRAARRLAVLALAAVAGGLAWAALLAWLAGPTGAAGTTRTYPGPAPCDTTLQACLDGASDGDTLILQVGTYDANLVLDRPISLTGVSSDSVVIHAAATGQPVLVAAGGAISNSVVISGVTITGGDVGGGLACPAHCGGGVVLTDSASPLFYNVIIRDNVAYRGAGVYAYPDSVLRMENSAVVNNESDNDGGGALAPEAHLTNSLFQDNRCLSTTSWCAGGGLRADALGLTSTRFIHNGGHFGGGAYVLGPAMLNAGTFALNSAGLAGGGLYALRTVMTDTDFVGNTGSEGGGAYLSADADVLGGTFEQNLAIGQGGGLYVYGVAAITGTQFVGNTAAQGGGLIIIAGGRLANALFARNTATFNGTAIFVNTDNAMLTSIVHTTIASPTAAAASAIHVQAGTAGITNTLIASHTLGIQRVGGSVLEDYNLFFGVNTPTAGGVASGGHSLTGEPAFVDPAAGNYALAADSAAINAGTEAGVPLDHEGDPRVGAPDIGFDEFVLARLMVPYVRAEGREQ